MCENDDKDGLWVFVSHSTKDFERVRLVRNALEDNGFRPILFYLKCLEKENEVIDLLRREIDVRKRFILCDSPNAQASKFVQSEIEYIRSKRRMYEVIDLSKIDTNKSNSYKDVLGLIKPFKRRTSVFLCYSHKDAELARELTSQLQALGFKTADADFYGPWPGNASIGDLETLIKTTIKLTLDEGYVIGLVSSNAGRYLWDEIEYAYQTNPFYTLPVVVDNIPLEKLSKDLFHLNFLDVGHIRSAKNKASAIVEALVAFDLEKNK